ncbi:hypothetical protein GCM10008969_13130 [Pseudomonas veronii subsp. inensis]
MTARQRTLHWHGRQPLHPRAAQQTKQQGFGLIVAVLADEQYFSCPDHITECLIARITGRALQACACPHLHAHHPQGHAKGVTDRLAMTRPGIGRSLQAMVDMNSAKRRKLLSFGEICQEVQQDGGIKPAGKSDMPGRSVAPGSQGLQEFGG